jgi:succinate dehydrogenase/fumarate reductase flavoprotein subunit
MGEHFECDVLVIGGGGAGIAAALAASAEGARAFLVTKEPAGYGNTRLSAGLLAYPGLLAEDDPEKFFRDIIVGGEFLSNQELAYTLAQEASQAAFLLEQEGLALERDDSGSLSSQVAIKLGGHSISRTLMNFSGGIGFGQVIKGALIKSGSRVIYQARVKKLLVTNDRVVGAIGLKISTGEIFTVAASQTILATGGGGWLYYPHTDVNRTTTGDGYTLAYEAGADLIDMEQVQFIPFALTHPKSMVGIVCGEPFTVGPRGKILNDDGQEFIIGASVKTRAQVSKAIILEVERGRGTKYGGVKLDLRENKQDPEGQRIKKTYETTLKALSDSVRFAYGHRAEDWEEPWDVYPTAHYFMGGVRIDVNGRCSHPKNLYAVGEVSGGLHGGNRLGSVSLAEIFVFGLRAGRYAGRTQEGEAIPPLPQKQVATEIERISSLRGIRGHYRPVDLIRRLQKTMWDCAGPVREEARLRRGEQILQAIEAQRKEMKISSLKRWNGEWVDALELSLMLPLARMIIRSSQVRTESRGAHIRLDFPQKDDDQNLRNTIIRKSSQEMAILTERVSFSRLHPQEL